jgi:hypothetical protein
MATHISDLAAAVAVVAAVPPVAPGGTLTGTAIDMIGTDGECFAVQTVGAFEPGPTWTGRVEQSADGTTWSTVATFAPVTTANAAQTVRFARTARYLRFNSAATGGTPDLLLAVLVGQARKTF